jgi:4-amino-4-deoxy-L-arabinose transferase-like glycosyltransferase
MSIQKATSLPILVIIAGLLAAFAVTSWTAWLGKSATYDEPLHFMGAWIQTHYDDFRCDPEDPPLWRYYAMLGTSKSELKVPTSGVEWNDMLGDRGVEGLFFQDVFYYTPENNAVAALIAARGRMLMLGVILGAAIAWWAWRLGGPAAGVVAAAAFCFDPNFLAHAPLVKDDVPIALALLLFMAAAWLVGQRATLWRCIAVSLALGAALTIKFSGVVAIPVLGIVLLIRALLPQPWNFLKWMAGTRAQRLAVAACIAFASCLIAYVFIWACYRFRYGPSVDPSQTFDFSELPRITAKHEAFAAYHAFTLTSEQLQQWNAHWKPGALFRLALWTGKSHLLPQTWIEGFLFSYGTAPGREAFLLGKSSMSGWWYYFPIAMAVKTPLATLIALLLSAAYWISRRASAVKSWDVLTLALMPVFYMAIAMGSDLNLGIRHVLPVYPFLFIFLGITAADALRRGRKIAKTLIGLCLLGLVLETYLAYPDFIPFFNVAAGGWRNGPNLLGDSNVDWGQELPALAQWQRANPQYQLFLNYFGSADPRYYHIHYVKLPGSVEPDDQTPSASLPRIYALSGNAAHNPWISRQDRDFYAKLQSQTPIAVLGHCIYLYNPP